MQDISQAEGEWNIAAISQLTSAFPPILDRHTPCHGTFSPLMGNVISLHITLLAILNMHSAHAHSYFEGDWKQVQNTSLLAIHLSMGKCTRVCAYKNKALITLRYGTAHEIPRHILR